MAHGHDVAVPLRQAMGASGQVEVRVLPERQHQVLFESRRLHAEMTPAKKDKGGKEEGTDGTTKAPKS